MSGRPCHCEAYEFPHRWGGGACDAPFPVSLRDEPVLGAGARHLFPEEAALDDRERAADMNAELRRRG